jgi:hypothetical protein
MAFYDLSKEERELLVQEIHQQIADELFSGTLNKTITWFSDEDTYIRKSAYLAAGRIYFNRVDLRSAILSMLNQYAGSENYKVRQTIINAAGEIGKYDFAIVQPIFDKGLFDPHHAPRNAVIGSVKKMGVVNAEPVLLWAKQYLHHTDKEIRREICHGIELRGRKFPADVLPLLQELEFDTTARVRNTLVHVIGQIAYKKGCLQIVIAHLKGWQNKQLVKDALEEIIDVHHRYRNFSAMTQAEAITYIQNNFSV